MNVQLVNLRGVTNASGDKLHMNASLALPIPVSNLRSQDSQPFEATHAHKRFTDDNRRHDARGWLELRIWAEMFHDAQDARKRTAQRMRSGTVDPTPYEVYFESMERSEVIVKRELAKCYKRVVPSEIRKWQDSAHGLGVHTFALLLGYLGDPVWAQPHHWEGVGASRVLITDTPFPRTLSQLHQYCGHGAPGRPARGMSAEQLAALGHPRLKTIMWNITKGCVMKFDSPYRAVYDRVREECAERVHTAACIRCGPSGRPAQPGSLWNPGHQMGHAYRMTGREILRDLWVVAGGLNGGPA